ncbi:MAG TPA: hypothetical protein PKO18_02715 [Chitinophagales bacterium]|nr:hypothetical protein [Chitinophagales bacterium]
MNEAKLYYTIKSLETNEISRLKKSLNDKFVANNSASIKLITAIILEKHLTAQDWNKQFIHTLIYPNLKYNDLRIRHLLSNSCKILEHFIISLKTNENKILLNEQLADFYLSTGSIKYAEQYIHESILSIIHKPKNSSAYQRLFELESKLYDIQLKNSRKTDNHILNMANNLSIYLIIETLKTACYIASNNVIIDEKTDFPVIKPIYQLAQEEIYYDIPQIKIYATLYRLLLNWTPKEFKKILPFIKKNEFLFKNDELYNIYKLLLNFCIKEANTNSHEFTKITFELYLYAIGKKYLLSYGQLNRFTLSNVIAIGLKLKDIKRAEDFLKANYRFIDKNFKLMTYNYNMAKILYAKNENQKSLKLLLSTEFKDALWYLNAKFITLKIFLDMDDMVRFNQYLKAFKMYIIRKQHIGYHKQYFSGVANAFKILLKIRKNSLKYQSYSFDLETPDRVWFQNKAMEYVNQIKTKKQHP